MDEMNGQPGSTLVLYALSIGVILAGLWVLLRGEGAADDDGRRMLAASGTVELSPCADSDRMLPSPIRRDSDAEHFSDKFADKFADEAGGSAAPMSTPRKRFNGACDESHEGQ